MLSVLIAEDDHLTSLGISEILDALLFEVCGVVETGPDAVAEAARLRPDVILMDVDLAQGTSGLAATQQVRHQLNIPVIVMSGRASERDAMLAGAFGFIAKPFRPDALVHALQDVAAARRVPETFWPPNAGVSSSRACRSA